MSELQSSGEEDDSLLSDLSIGSSDQISEDFIGSGLLSGKQEQQDEQLAGFISEKSPF